MPGPTAKFCFLLILLTSIAACRTKEKNTLFSRLDSSKSGIHFSNNIQDNDSSKSFINEFGYMGGGVGIGDFNNDGLKDIVFTANQESCRIYQNTGNNQFTDITIQAGLNTNSWATGVSIVDINTDGFDDIYICTYGKNLLERSKNMLFINQKDMTFKEAAAEYGLADSNYSSQAVFFDYDRDGDLDMYLANYSFDNTNTSANNIVPRNNSGTSLANDRLYRNNGDSAQKGHPVFQDVSAEAGIREDGYGLGVIISDLDKDGWPDIYTANDFISNDNLWLNNRNGTFTNCISTSMKHQSYSSMGVDAADLNNDGRADIVTLDMLPEDNYRKKTSFSFMNYERYQTERARGYEPEFMRNMLQLNMGNRLIGDTSIPYFSEIGQLAGIAATDWSWSVLLADFDNDGWKDMHITNGVGRDFINADFLEFSSQVLQGNQSKAEQRKQIQQKLASLDHVRLPNYLYLNNGDLSFRNFSKESGVDNPSMSNGAAYADLDNDGDLDLVINNINEEASILINQTRQSQKDSARHFIKFILNGPAENRRGFGARIRLYQSDRIQELEQNPVRGYFSSVDPDPIMGLGDNRRIDSLEIIWPDGRKEIQRNILGDSTLVLNYTNSTTQQSPSEILPATAMFTEMNGQSGIRYRHEEYEFNDFAYQRLLPQKYSQLGPFMSVADVNNDGLSDFFIGGAANQPGQIFRQTKDQRFTAFPVTMDLIPLDDMDCLFFDADKDNDMDLLITAGDVQQPESSPHYKPRLYINDGKGNFSLSASSIPAEVRTIAGTVASGDYDGDGDMDLFIGGRVSARYPLPAKSFILRNDAGVFTDVTQSMNPALVSPGMITAAAWVDFNKDQLPDLIIAGEWMNIRFFKNTGKGLEETTAATGIEQMEGMWRSLAVADLDQDGDLDLVAGNLGLNCLYAADKDHPMEVHAKDLDGNGSIDPIMFYHIMDADGKRRLYPSAGRGQLADQMPSVKKQFLLAKDYAKATANDIIPANKRDQLIKLSCNETRSCYFENLGGGKFKKHPLPVQAQFAPVNAILITDLNQDGWPDLILGGNEYQTEVMTGRYDASYGLVLMGTKDKTFNALSPSQSGLLIDGDVKDLELVSLPGNEKLLLASLNNDSLKVFRLAR